MKSLTLVLFLSVLIVNGCSKPEEDRSDENLDGVESQQKESGKKIVARINGNPVYRSDLKNRTVDKAIEDELIYQEALKRGIDKEVQDEIEQYKRNLMVRLLRDKVIKEESLVTDEEIKSYYQTNLGNYISVLLKELIIKDEETAREAYRRAVSGEDFDKLTAEYKADDNAHAHSHVKVDPPYRDRFLTKDEGAVEMFEHPEGMKIAKLTEKHEIPLSRVSNIIENRLKGRSGTERFNKFIEKIKDQSEIEIVSEDESDHDSGHSSMDPGDHPHHKMLKAGFRKDEFLNDAHECMNIPHSFERTQCFQPYFNYVTHKKSAYYTLQLAKSLEDDGVIRDCHMVAHHTGMSVLQKNNFDVEKAFDECTPDCVQGCYHAVLENYVGHANWEQNEIAGKGTELCNRISRGDRLKNRQCIHGVGHGMVKDHYLGVQEASGICRELSGSVRIDSCLGGVFMEHANRIILPANEKELAELLPQVCDIELADEILMEKCARAVGEGVMFFSGHDIQKSAQLCKNLKDKQIKSCIDAAEEMHKSLQ